MRNKRADGSRPTGDLCPCDKELCEFCDPKDSHLLSKSHPKEYGEGFDFYTGRVHPRLVDINHTSYQPGSKEWSSWWAGHNHAEECAAREKKILAEMTTIGTVGELRKALEGLPPEMPIAAYDPYDHLLTIEKVEEITRRMDIHTPTLVIKTR